LELKGSLFFQGIKSDLKMQIQEKIVPHMVGALHNTPHKFGGANLK